MDAIAPNDSKTGGANFAQLPAGLGRSLRRLGAGDAVVFEGLNVTQATVCGHAMQFCWTNPHDPIQGHLRHGTFYEADELAVLARYFPIGGVLVDVGANVGNHSLYFAKLLSATRVVPIEPNPQVISLLLANIALNGLTARFDLRFVGLGLSDASAGGFAMQARVHNLGGAKMLAGEGDIEVIAGDSFGVDLAPSMIKIDVEGMEMQVLAGFAQTIAAHKPLIFVEVDRRNYDAFEAWLAGSPYEAVETFSRYRANTNYLLKAKVAQ